MSDTTVDDHPTAASQPGVFDDEAADSVPDGAVPQGPGDVDPADSGEGPDEPLVDAPPASSWLETSVTFVVVAACAWFVFHSLHPVQIFRDTTPTGGDMGSHVWGPMFLEQYLLPKGRLSGWSPDWYAGFPAYQFYMVVPSLLVVALHVGFRNLLLIPAVIGSGALAASGWFRARLHPWRKHLLVLGSVLLVLSVPVPYNIAFKLVTVSGLVGLPIACWAFGKLTDLPFPGPPMLAVASLFFIYNREPTLNGGTGNIIGGNMASTMAGEFAFSISLTLCVLYLGVMIRGLRTGKHSGSAALLLALCGLCHLIPVFFALVCSVIALAVFPGRARFRWAFPTAVVSALLSAFWVVPFLLRHPYFNDMGWEKVPAPNARDGQNNLQDVWDYLAPRALWWPLAFAVVGVMVVLVFRYRAGLVLVGGMVVSGLAFQLVPQAALWNARLLPFYYLSLFLLGGVGASELTRAVATLTARDPMRPGRAVPVAGLAVATLVAMVFVGIPLGRLPGSTYPASGGVTWLGLHRDYRNDVPGWAQWNYKGLEEKDPVVGPGGKVPDGQGGWPEFRAMVATMAALGEDPDHGCGRAFWEYGGRLETYGTPMAPMMIPYFTDGCIGSMEGLYFESSSTTPFHFLVQCQLSEQGSCAQRDLAYGQFDIDKGISQLQMLGVKYYMAFTDKATTAAAARSDLTEVAVAGPWRIYQLPEAETALVEPLRYEPVVLDIEGSEGSPLSRVQRAITGSSPNDPQDVWLDPAVSWFMDPEAWDVPLAADGPSDWARMKLPESDLVRDADNKLNRRVGEVDLPAARRTPVTPAVVTDIRTDDDSIEFDVDRVGSPVVVKTSYFPNWKASGADGPYRITPNLMVVIPTSTHVELSYRRTAIDWAGMLLTLIGIGGLVLLYRREPVEMPPPARFWTALTPADPGPKDAPDLGPVPLPPDWAALLGEEGVSYADLPTGAPTDAPVDRPADGPVDRPADGPVDRPADQPDDPDPAGPERGAEDRPE